MPRQFACQSSVIMIPEKHFPDEIQKRLSLLSLEEGNRIAETPVGNQIFVEKAT